MPCPICKKPAIEHHKPFCSKRCSHVDLHRWFNGAYKIETEEYISPEEYEDVIRSQFHDPDK